MWLRCRVVGWFFVVVFFCVYVCWFCVLLGFFFGLAASDNYENLHCELMMFLLGTMLGLVTVSSWMFLEFIGS